MRHRRCEGHNATTSVAHLKLQRASARAHDSTPDHPASSIAGQGECAASSPKLRRASAEGRGRATVSRGASARSGLAEEADWRRGRDSNPRYGCPYAAFRVRCIRPLCHLSELRRLERRGAVFSGDGGETQGRARVAPYQSSRPSLRSSEYGPPPRSAMAKEIKPHISVYS